MGGTGDVEETQLFYKEDQYFIATRIYLTMTLFVVLQV